GPGGPALELPAVGNAVWLTNELLARRDLAGVWLKRGPSRPSEIRSAHRGPIDETKEDVREGDDRRGPAQGIAHRGGHQRGRGGAGQAEGASDASPSRPAAR